MIIFSLNIFYTVHFSAVGVGFILGSVITNPFTIKINMDRTYNIYFFIHYKSNFFVGYSLCFGCIFSCKSPLFFCYIWVPWTMLYFYLIWCYYKRTIRSNNIKLIKRNCQVPSQIRQIGGKFF